MNDYFYDMLTIKENIRRLRKNRGLTQVQLAEELGTIQKVITDYETGKTKPPSERLLNIAKFFDVTVDELLGAGELSTAKPHKNNNHRHGNSRSAKLVQLFDKLNADEQRMTLKQIRALAEIKR